MAIIPGMQGHDDSFRPVGRARLPAWLKPPRTPKGQFGAVQKLLAQRRLHTVCQGAQCPNRRQCWSEGTATFMILGAACTRQCAFCGVRPGVPGPVDADEPARVAAAATDLRLRHVVITSVTRDDLPDGGAGMFAATILALRQALPASTVEVLTPDFQGDLAALAQALAARPDVFNHNLETVARLQPAIRPQASYARSLAVLAAAARLAPDLLVKSGLMVGLGETDLELDAAMQDLRRAGCRALTMGQYLQPRRDRAPVARFVPPEGFAAYAGRARELGFTQVASAPLVRSSFHAADLCSPPIASPRA